MEASLTCCRPQNISSLSAEVRGRHCPPLVRKCVRPRSCPREKSTRCTNVLIGQILSKVRHVATVFRRKPWLNDDDVGPQRHRVMCPHWMLHQFLQHGLVFSLKCDLIGAARFAHPRWLFHNNFWFLGWFVGLVFACGLRSNGSLFGKHMRFELLASRCGVEPIIAVSFRTPFFSSFARFSHFLSSNFPEQNRRAIPQ